MRLACQKSFSRVRRDFSLFTGLQASIFRFPIIQRIRPPTNSDLRN